MTESTTTEIRTFVTYPSGTLLLKTRQTMFGPADALVRTVSTYHWLYEGVPTDDQDCPWMPGKLLCEGRIDEVQQVAWAIALAKVAQ